MRTPVPEDLPSIAELLMASNLPADDLLDLDLALFLVEGSEGVVHAVGGLEKCGDTALLRSVATASGERGRGLAKTIAQELERMAESEGIGELYLLTESAAGYFEALGYLCCSRKEVPVSISASRQFSSLCPADAVVMSKRIGNKRRVGFQPGGHLPARIHRLP